jgi:hypothetical protein
MTLAVFAVLAVFLFDFWERKTIAKKFSTAKNAETAKTLDRGRTGLVGNRCQAEQVGATCKGGRFFDN